MTSWSVLRQDPERFARMLIGASKSSLLNPRQPFAAEPVEEPRVASSVKAKRRAAAKRARASRKRNRS